MGVDKTAVLGISTPQDEMNYYSELIARKDQYGEPVFMSLELGKCKACLKAGIKCTHSRVVDPSWKSPDGMAKCDAIMSCNPAMRERELHGTVTSDKKFIIDKDDIDKFKVRPRHVFECGTPDVLYTAIDPSGGGRGSDYAILTMAMSNGRPVVRNDDDTSATDRRQMSPSFCRSTARVATVRSPCAR